MFKKDYTIFIRNQETNELHEVIKKAFTVDEAIDKVEDKLASPWRVAKFETAEHYTK